MSRAELRALVAVILAGVGACAVCLVLTAPASVARQARPLFEHQQRLLLEQTAATLSQRLHDLTQRLGDPLLLEAAGLDGADRTSSLETALARLGRPGDGEQAVSLMLHDGQGLVLAVDPRLPLGEALRLQTHVHRTPEGSWQPGVGVCTECLRSHSRLALAQPLPSGLWLAALVELPALLKEPSQRLLAFTTGSRLSLLDDQGHVLMNASGRGSAPARGEHLEAVAGLAVAGQQLQLRVVSPVAALTSAIEREARNQALLAGFVLLLAGLGTAMLLLLERRHTEQERFRLHVLAELGRRAARHAIHAGVLEQLELALERARPGLERARTAQSGAPPEQLEQLQDAFDGLERLREQLDRERPHSTALVGRGAAQS